MEVLLDTHAYLWALTEPKKLSRRARTILENPSTHLRVSSATAWEIATKWRLGNLPRGEALVLSYDEHLARLGADDLPVSARHALLAGRFPQEHRDPFDRMLAAQANLEKLPLLTRDEAFRAFPVEVLW